MIHQSSHGVIGSKYVIRHGAPVIGGGAEIGRQGAVIILVIGMVACTLLRIVPVLHDLGHGCCNTASHSATGTVGIIVRSLIPAGGEQRIDLQQGVCTRSFTGKQRRPPGADLVGGGYFMLQYIPYFRPVLFKPLVNMWRKGLFRKRTLFGITRNRPKVVVGRNHHKSLFTDIKNIVQSHRLRERFAIQKRRLLRERERYRLGGTAARHTVKVGGNKAGSCFINRFGGQGEAQEKSIEGKKNAHGYLFFL